MQRVGVVAAAAALLVLAGCASSSSGTPAPEPAGSPAALPGLPAGARVDYQLGGVVRDRTAEPAPGLWSACYVNAFQTQPDSSDWPEDLLLHGDDGRRVADPDWPDEFLVDISTPEQRDRALAVVGPWVDGCAADGFAAVEADNLDSWTRSAGLLDVEDAAAFARLLVDRAHAVGLAIAQKNAAELTGTGLGFDLAVTEDCGRYDECAGYTEVYGTVLDVEYTDEGFGRACAVPGLSAQRRDLAVAGPDDPGHVAEWC